MMVNVGKYLGGGFKYFVFSSLLGEDEPIFDQDFSDGLVQPPTSWGMIEFCTIFLKKGVLG